MSSSSGHGFPAAAAVKAAAMAASCWAIVLSVFAASSTVAPGAWSRFPNRVANWPVDANADADCRGAAGNETLCRLKCVLQGAQRRGGVGDIEICQRRGELGGDLLQRVDHVIGDRGGDRGVHAGDRSADAGSDEHLVGQQRQNFLGSRKRRCGRARAWLSGLALSGAARVVRSVSRVDSGLVMGETPCL